MRLKRDWLVQGHFEVADPEGGESVTQRVRSYLAGRLGLSPGAVRIASYPVGPVWRHTFWWREGDADYAETQFFAQVAKEYPVLSVGVSVEKGLEDESCAPAVDWDKYRMDRRTWDWQRLTQVAADVLDNDVPACAQELSRPVTVRLLAHRYDLGAVTRHESRVFVFADGSWFERHLGRATSSAIVEFVQALDIRRCWWVDAYFSSDLPPAEVDGMSPETLAEIIWSFDSIRRRLRGSAV